MGACRAVTNEDFECEMKEYDLSSVPEYRRPVIEELVCATDVFSSGFDTVENIDGVAVRIFDLIVSQHLLDAHLRANILPESHDI